MEVSHIFLIFVMIFGVQSTFLRNSRSETVEQQCEKACEGCFDTQDSLQRMGCLEKCVAVGVGQFTCPGKQSFLSAVIPPTPNIKALVEDFFARRSAMFSAKDVEGVASGFTEYDSVLVVDNQKPTIGRAERAHQLNDYFMANPEMDRTNFEPVDFGEENGIIWVNGVETSYNKQKEKITTIRFMSLLRRVGAELQEFMIVLFPVSSDVE